MEIQCKQCRSLIVVGHPEFGVVHQIKCGKCGCDMGLIVTNSGTAILSLTIGTKSDDNSLVDITNDANSPRLNRVLYSVSSIPAPPTDRNGWPINSKTGQIVFYRKQLSELEKQERYEDCAKVRDKLNELIYSDIK